MAASIPNFVDFKPFIFLMFALSLCSCEAYFADWGVLGGRPQEPTCVDIPKNMSLCSDIGYDKMRLPNLLDHDTLTEVQQQSGSWVPLVNVRCHPDTKLFLCSLFTPVCLENQIYPCRSLCETVQTSCESRMRNYGYHWPDMLRCDRFPEDNDMCIKSQKKEKRNNDKDEYCSACSPVETYENILDSFCSSDYVFRARVSKQRGAKVSIKKARHFKNYGQPNRSSVKAGGSTRRRKLKLHLVGNSSCCSFFPGKQQYLIMGKKSPRREYYVEPNFVVPWRKSKMMRQALKMFPNLNCTDPNLFTPSTDPDGDIVPQPTKEPTKKLTKKQRRKLSKKERRKLRKEQRKGDKSEKGKNRKNRERKGRKGKKDKKESDKKDKIERRRQRRKRLKQEKNKSRGGEEEV